MDGFILSQKKKNENDSKIGLPRGGVGRSVEDGRHADTPALTLGTTH